MDTNTQTNPSLDNHTNTKMTLGFMLGAALGLGIAAYHNQKKNHHIQAAVQDHVHNFATHLPEYVDQWFEGYWSKQPSSSDTCSKSSDQQA